jgi:Spy/CpxP family protein refolding chaperone
MKTNFTNHHRKTTACSQAPLTLVFVFLKGSFFMTFNLTPSPRLKGLFLAGLLAAGASVMAQGTPSAAQSPGPRTEHMGMRDPAKMQAMMAQHQTDLKAKLKLTPAQEGAWTAYTTAMQPPAGMGTSPTEAQRAEMNKLTTPERIDKMRAMRTERMTQMNAAMDKRGDATKALYAALTPEQKKVFDAEHEKHGAPGEHGMHGSSDPKKK